jgi:hypothetical protein
MFPGTDRTPTRGQTVIAGISGLLLFVLGIGLGYVFFSSSRSTATPLSPSPAAPPVEIVYLDLGRVTTYLSQVTNGLTTGEELTLTQAQQLSAGLSGSAGSLGAQSSSQSSVVEKVTPTSASSLALLEDRLCSKHWLTTLVQTSSPTDKHSVSKLWATNSPVQPGSFVAVDIRNGYTFPNYGLIFPYLFTAPGLRPAALPLSWSADNGTLLLLLSVSALADPDLFLGPLTVIGKLLIPVHDHYTDALNSARFNQEFHQLTAAKFEKVVFPDGKLSVSKKESTIERRRIQRQATKAYRVQGSGAVILPIAIQTGNVPYLTTGTGEHTRRTPDICKNRT